MNETLLIVFFFLYYKKLTTKIIIRCDLFNGGLHRSLVILINQTNVIVQLKYNKDSELL